MKALKILVCLAVIVGALLPVTSALAIANPDTPPVIESVHVYGGAPGLLETNDYLLVIYARIPYASPPTESVSDAFVWRLFDDTNTNEYGTSTSYAYHDNGYDYNVTSFYFDNTSAPAWGEQVFIKLEGNPTVFVTPPTYEWQIAVADYSTATTRADMRTDMAAVIIAIANDLGQRWALTSTTSLVQSDVTDKLSVAGEAFFRGAIYGLMGLCPNLFSYSVGDITITDRNWTLTYSNNLASQWAGTWVADAQQAGKEFFQVDYDLLSVLLVVVLCVGIVVANILISGDTWGGFIDAGVIMIATARLGLYPLAFLALIAALGVVYISLRIWGLGR